MNGEGARSHIMNGDKGISFTDSKDIPQFAPNFTVYLLPPDVVCLYSEDRKFFLHGELYCALATAIGKGGKSFRDLFRTLERDFPADKIQEALKRLVDRRYVVPASRNSSKRFQRSRGRLLGEPRSAARDCGAESAVNCRVRIEVDRRRRRDGTRRRPERTRGSRRQALPRPDRHAGQRLSRRPAGRIEPATSGGPYRLGCSSQPSGVFPLVGPVFTPGQGACWTCLFDRMIRNREVKALLDRRAARCVAVSPLARQPARTKRASSLPPSRSPRRSPPLSHRFARSHRQPRPAGLGHRASIMWRPARNARAAAARSCGTRAGRRRRSSLAPAASW